MKLKFISLTACYLIPRTVLVTTEQELNKYLLSIALLDLFIKASEKERCLD